MEFSFSDEPKKGGTPATKVYSPKKRAEAAKDAPEAEKARARDGQPKRNARKARAPQPATPLSRLGLMLSGFLLAGMLLFTLSGYERISRAYADINTINSAIDETELRIKALDVQIECAVTIRDAQETAERYGMRYPEQSQYVKVGSAIPVSGTAPSGSAPAGNGPGDTVSPGGTDTPDDAPADGGNPSGD